MRCAATRVEVDLRAYVLNDQLLYHSNIEYDDNDL